MPRPPKKFVPTPFAYHEEIELRIDALTNLGAGVGRIDGWVVFVPFTLPGERVRARVFRNDKNCSHADLIEVLDASPERVAPRCALFGECGGCQYQHLDYASQLVWKARQVGELMQHMAGITFPVNPCLSSEQIWNYRSKITPHFEKSRDGDLGPIGFLAFGRRSLLIDVPQCPIAMDEINAALPAIRADLRARAPTFKRGATILLRASEGRVETNANATVCEHVGALANTADIDDAGARQNEAAGRMPAPRGPGILPGASFQIAQRANSSGMVALALQFLAGDFFQNNPFILPAFTRHVATQAAGGGALFLVDAYCGSGLFALSLAGHFQQVAGVEVSETSCEWARKNAAANGITNVRFLTAPAEAIFDEISFPAAQTAVVIDPPRKGCTSEFLEQLLLFGPARIVYVSCDPATQVRDLKLLSAAGYALSDVQPFDLFPHTRHLECVMTLLR